MDDLDFSMSAPGLLDDHPGNSNAGAMSSSSSTPSAARKKGRRGADPASQKRRCVSTACIACRKRKSKCDGALPSCAACASVYGTECVYDPNSDHRRKGVYREKIDSMKARSSTLQVLIEAILNADENDVPTIVKQIRTCDSLDTVAEAILRNEYGPGATENGLDDDDESFDDAMYPGANPPDEGERDLARKMGELRVENGSVRFIGGTSHLIYLGDTPNVPEEPESENYMSAEDPITSWSEVTKDTQLIVHLINMYFAWHYPYFTTLSKTLFYRDFFAGRPTGKPRTTVYCTPLLVNAMLALGCHFTSVPGAYGIPGDNRTKGDHFFGEAKRLIVENDEYEKPRLTTVQALALMSVREAGCGREAKGWVYSGMSFRMAQDIGLNLDIGGAGKGQGTLDEQEVDARRITFWGCFLFDKAWSNYLGRLPQLPRSSFNVPKYDVFPDEDAEPWSPYTDGGPDQSSKQPSRTRAASLQLMKLCEISSDLLLFFYHPNHIGRSSGKSVELKKLSELHRRLEDWKKELPREFEPKEAQLPNVILTHMFYHLQYIHLFRPFLKYTPASSPLPSHVSPRRICTANAGAISKLMRLYKKTYNLRQICNIAVYMIHSAVTIHMLNLPEKTAKRDVIHGIKHLEEIAEDWLCARRTLSIISVLARKWGVDLPDEAAAVLQRTDEKYGSFSTADVPSPNRSVGSMVATTPSPPSYPGSPPPARHHDGGGHPQFNSPLLMGYHSQHATPPPQMALDGLPVSSMSPDLLASLAMPADQQQQMGHLVSGPPMSMSDALSSAWSLPAGVTSQPMGGGGYSHQQQQQQGGGFSPVPMGGGSGGGDTPRSLAANNSNDERLRHVSPQSVYAIDGQDWYLKDGVNWQQNFETWASNSGTGGGGGGSGGGGQGLASPSMFMFQGLRGGGGAGPGGDGGSGGGGLVDATGFEAALGAMGSLDHLPGLD